MVEFAGWKMPVQYTGIIDEHNAVRSAAGIFDVSHMGEFKVTGPGAKQFLDRALTNDMEKLQPGKALYNLMLNEQGGIIDDLIVYQSSVSEYLLCVNASNRHKDYGWLLSHTMEDAELTDVSDDTALIALQGPKASAILENVREQKLDGLKRFSCMTGRLAGTDCLIARTGYTGEDGFEIFIPWNSAPDIWNALMGAGADVGLKPVGLGARDTLRLEMGYALYGSDIDETTNPIEAGLKWVCALDKSNFIGKNALLKVLDSGPPRCLVGIKLKARGIPRHGMKILASSSDEEIGVVTSGTMSPSLKEPIAMGYVAAEHSAVGNELTLDIRGKRTPAEVVAMPFGKPQKK